MFENIMKFIKRFSKKSNNNSSSKNTAKERLHLVLMQDRANVSADFLDLMRQEIIDVIKKYIEVDESAIDVRLTNKENDDGTNGAPALYANIPIINIKEDVKKDDEKVEKNQEDNSKESSTIVPEKKDDDTKEKIENIESNNEKETDKEDISQEKQKQE